MGASCGKKVFILGVGAQKSGTTWLYEQLSRSSNVNLGFMKEYHVFDALYVPECRVFRENTLKAVWDREKSSLLGVNNNLGDKNAVKRLSFIDDCENYFEYFHYLSLAPEVRAVGDITPSYSMLSQDTLRYIKKSLEDKDFEVKVIFLMREPVERIWSMLRMIKKNDPSFASLGDEQDILNLHCRSDVEKRTRYETTIENLESVFESNNIFYGFYESFFNSKTFHSLEEFLGFKIDEVNFSERVNKTRKSCEISDETRRVVKSYYSSTYSYVYDKFGFKIKRLWEI